MKLNQIAQAGRQIGATNFRVKLEGKIVATCSCEIGKLLIECPSTRWAEDLPVSNLLQGMMFAISQKIIEAVIQKSEIEFHIEGKWI